MRFFFESGLTLRRAVLSIWVVCLIPGSILARDEGSRPRGVAVSSDGKAIITTSEGSNYVVAKNHGSTYHVEVDPDPDAHTWGVCFVDLAKAVVTVPTRTSLAVVEWNGTQWVDSSVGDIDYYLTEVIPSPTGGHVLVASRGSAPTGGEPWQHAVYEVNVSTGAVTKTFITERQPRSLALSPDGTVLFVATALGALGGDGIATDVSLDGDPAILPQDGGSIVSYEYSTQNPIDRFPVGSPVRGLAVWPGTNEFRLYFSHHGGGAQGEAPELGGRLIPNVLSSIRFDSNNDPDTGVGGKMEVVLDHDPDFEATPSNLAAIVPDRMAVQTTTPAWLWVTNSGSGTVSGIELDMTDGFVVQAPSEDVNLLGFNQSDINAVFETFVGRNADLSPNMVTATANNVRVHFRVVDDPVVLLVDSSNPAPSPAYSSNPRGITYDATNDRILAVTRFDHELIEIDGATQTISSQQSLLLSGTSAVPAAERNFFTFGEGFNFREALGASKTNTFSCGTCHVDGHIDAKMHKTPISATFVDNDPEDANAAVPPSVFDVGNSEWLFLDGQSTILDDDDGCAYCESQRFFRDTKAFTDDARSPHSPYADDPSPGSDADLTDNQLRGRAWFDQLNCSRCHAGTVDTFFRSTDNQLGQTTGPLTANALAPRMLSDPTQVFVADCPNDDCDDIEGGASIKNMTDVGTRPARGANTPALAGAWDNAPYFHDGRYRDLNEVLADTWLTNFNNGPCEEGYLAAPLWECVDVEGPAVTVSVPDNFANRFDHVTDDTQVNTVVGGNPLLFPFRTHDDSPPSGTVSVKDYFEITINDPQSYDDLKDFLLSLSSFTDPCSGPALSISAVSDSYDAGTGTTTLSWTTSYPISCTGTYGESGQASTPFTTPIGTSHQVSIVGFCLGTSYEINIDADRRRGVCDAESASATHTWTNAGTLSISNLQQSPALDCSENVVTWNTNVSVGTTLEWGLFGQGYPNSINTGAGVSHQGTIPTVPGKRYQGRVVATCDGQSDTENFTWATRFCGSPKMAAPSDEFGILAASPNPFNPSTTISYRIQSEGRVSLRIYDTAGRLVRTLQEERLPAGTHEVRWDGRANGGGRVATGVYFVRLTTSDSKYHKKILLLE